MKQPWSRGPSLRRQLLMVAVASLVLAVSGGGALVLVAQRRALHESARDSTRIIASTVAENVSAPLLFDDPQGAQEVLDRLRATESVKAAVLRDMTGATFARFARPKADGLPLEPATTAPDGPVSDGWIVVHQSVRQHGTEIGTLSLAQSTEALERSVAATARQIVAGGLLLLLLSALVSLRLQAHVTRPILALTEATRRIRESGDLAERVHQSGSNEIATLSQSFNDMLEQLQQREARLQALVSSLPDEIFILDDRGCCLDAMSPSHRTRAQQGMDAVGRPLDDLLGDVAASRVRDGIARALESNRPVAVDYETSVDGQRAQFEAVLTTMRHEWKGAPRTVLLVARDVSARKALEERYRQAQKMEAIGQLAGGIAHDFNNLLTGVIGFAELLSMRYPDDPAPAQIIDVGMRAAELVKHLLAFARRTQSKFEPVDLNEVVKRAHGILSRTVDRLIGIELTIAPEGCIVHGDSAQLQSAVLNLGINARDAMPEGGTLRLATRRIKLDAGAAAAIDGELSAGTYVEISVTDTGCGIPAQLRERIFEPFFTTKEAGRGTGLGLAAVYGTVRAHRGGIQLESEVGSGSAFRILLPTVQAVVTADAVPVLRRGSGHIVVVDDERVVREVTERLLCAAGYRVTCFAAPEEALEYFRLSEDAVDLALIDMVMPGMNGAQLAAHVERLRPEVAVVFATGYPQGGDGLAPDMSGHTVLAKPFSADMLSSTIQNVLGDRKPPSDARAPPVRAVSDGPSPLPKQDGPRT